MIIAFCVLLATFHLSQMAPVPNLLGRVGDILFEQKIRLIENPGRDDIMTGFQSCLKKDHWNQASYHFSIEGEELSLACTPCIPSVPVYWNMITFEGEESPVPNNHLYERNGQNLLIRSIQPDIITYYCYWEYENKLNNKIVQIISSVKTVEVAPIDKLDKISVRSWQRNKTNQFGPFQLQLGNERLEIATSWNKWSGCSNCGRVGKRHRIGVCSIRSLSPDKYDLKNYLAFRTYNTPISCTLFLDLHPEAVSESLKEFEESQREIHELGRKHVILIGYCKKTCSDWKRGASAFLKDKLYAEFPLVGKKLEEEKSKSFMKVFRSLITGVPFGWDTLPEIIVFISLISVQFYIIYLVIKSRKVAVNG